MILRGVSWAPILAATAVGLLILGGCAAFAGDSPPLLPLRLALAALAGAAAFVLDEPAAAAVDSAPTTLRRRTALRVTAATIPLTVWGVGVLALNLRSAQTPLGHLVVEGAGVVAVTVAAAAVLRGAGFDEPGEGVAIVVGGAILGWVTFNPPPHSVPPFPVSDGWMASTTLWSSLAVVAAVLVFLASRDPHRP